MAKRQNEQMQSSISKEAGILDGRLHVRVYRKEEANRTVGGECVSNQSNLKLIKYTYALLNCVAMPNAL